MTDYGRTLPAAADAPAVFHPSRPLPRSPRKKSGSRSRRVRAPAAPIGSTCKHFMRTLLIATPEELRQADHRR